MRALIKRIPLLGPLVHWVYAVLRLNPIRRQIARDFDALRQMQQANDLNTRHRLDQLSHRLDQFDALNIGRRLDQLDAMNIGQRLDQLDVMNIGQRLEQLDALNIGRRMEQLDALNIDKRLQRLDAINIGYRLNRLDVLDIANRLNVFDAINIANRLYGFDEAMREDQARNIERDNRIAGLTQELRRSAQPVASAAATPKNAAATASLSSFDADSFYLEFESLFRGSREDIKSRLQVYLPQLAHLAGNAEAHVLDIGCGRGEWLELLAEHGIRAIGIDLNRAVVSDCQARGLAVECAEAITYLRRQAEGSLAAVTGFHIIEHLPFEALIALFDAALLALRKDGLILFETPNPENIAVGACNFYFDPSHQRPIVPAVAEFIARQRGFARAEILRVNPYPDSYLLTEDSELARRINKLFYGPQDYAVLAWKTHAH